MAAKDEMPENLIYMQGEEYAQHNAFISGFAYGRMTALDSEMAMHWWCRGYERDPYCHGSPENLLAALTAAQAEADALRAEIARKDALLRECLRWLPLIEGHEAGSTTDLLCDSISEALGDGQ